MAVYGAGFRLYERIYTEQQELAAFGVCRTCSVTAGAVYIG